MSDSSNPANDISPSPSIYSYQTRLTGKTSSQGLAAAAASPDDMPSGSRPPSRLNSLRDDSSVDGLRRSGSGARIGLSGSGSRGGKSINSVRGQWEAKIEAAATEADQPPPPTLRRPRSVLLSSTASAASQLKSSSSSRDKVEEVTTAPPDTRSFSSRASDRASKRSTVSGVPGWDSSRVESATSPMTVSKFPPSTTESTEPQKSTSTDPSLDLLDSARSTSASDTLAQARANALRRLEAKKAAGLVIEEPKIDLPPMPTIPSPPKRVTTAPSSRPASISNRKALFSAEESKSHDQPAAKTVRKAQSAQSLVTKVEVKEKSEEVEVPWSRSRLKSVSKDAAPTATVNTVTPEGRKPQLRTAQQDTPKSRPPSIFDSAVPAPSAPTQQSTIPTAASGSVLRKVKSFDTGENPVLRKVKSFDTGAREPPKFLHKNATEDKASLDSKPTAAPSAATKSAESASRPAAPGGSKDTSPTKAGKFPGLTFRAPTGPPKGTVSSLANRWTAGDVAGPSSGSTPAPQKRIPSLSSDRRRLGKHLPRIVSGDQGWDGDGRRPSQPRVASAVRNRKSSLGRNVLPTPTEENTPPRETQQRERTAPSTPSVKRPLEPSAKTNQVEATPSAPSTPRKQSAKNGTLNLVTPRAEVTGAEMKGLMSAVGAASARKDSNTGEAVAGMSNRLRLSSRLPLAASSAKLAPAPLPSKRLAVNNWMDKQRHDLAAYEYLCHVGEAQQWIEGCLDEELEFGVTEMDDGLKDGVALAKLARVFQGEEVVKRIWTEAKHRFRQSDNINYFLNFVRTVGMPETFIFELTDLYNKKNIPKVIFCIHVLSHLLARLGRAERMNNLVGQFEFTDEQLKATEKGIQGIAMPNFQQVGQTLAKEASWEAPVEEEEEETEDERKSNVSFD